jgi:hypothetical protein
VYIPQPYQPTGFNVEKMTAHRLAKTGFLCIIYIRVALRGSFVFFCLQPNVRMLPDFTSSAGHAAAHIYMHLNLSPLLWLASNHLYTLNRINPQIHIHWHLLQANDSRQSSVIVIFLSVEQTGTNPTPAPVNEVLRLHTLPVLFRCLFLRLYLCLCPSLSKVKIYGSGSSSITFSISKDTCQVELIL